MYASLNGTQNIRIKDPMKKEGSKGIDDYYKKGTVDQSVYDLIEGYMNDLKPGKRVEK